MVLQVWDIVDTRAPPLCGRWCRWGCRRVPVITRARRTVEHGDFAAVLAEEGGAVPGCGAEIDWDGPLSVLRPPGLGCLQLPLPGLIPGRTLAWRAVPGTVVGAEVCRVAAFDGSHKLHVYALLASS